MLQGLMHLEVSKCLEDQGQQEYPDDESALADHVHQKAICYDGSLARPADRVKVCTMHVHGASARCRAQTD